MPRNVILISIDTCRADHLGCYGFDGPITPRIDEIASEGILFEKARTPVPLTLPAHCSMLTGTYPPYHQVHDNYEYELGDFNVTLAEILQKNGYATGAIISSFVLDQQFGIDQGFDNYHDKFAQPAGANEQQERSGEEASRFACEFLTEHQSEPFFLFLHYFDPHYEYEPPEPFATRYEDDLYAGEIAYTDYCIGQVIDQLKKLGLYDSTLIIIVGDHGESLGEHGESEHGYFIYQNTIHVPFVLRAPGMSEAREVEQTVSLVDVAPTILSYLDLPIPDHVQGIDLSGYSEAKNFSEPERYVYTESLTPTIFGCNALLGVINGQWSYIHTKIPELYDLDQDRQELHNLADQEAQQVRLMNSHLQEMVVQLVGAELVDSRLELDAESQRRLRSLGYIGGVTVDEPLIIDPCKDDPKTMVQCNEYSQEASRLMADKQYDAAWALVQEILAQWPQVPGVYTYMIMIAFETNNPEEVINYGRQYMALNPEANLIDRADDNSFQIDKIAYFYDLMVQSALKLERFDLVVEFGNKQLHLQPDAMGVLETLATAYFEQGQHDQAFKHWGKILQFYPDVAEIYGNVGLAYYRLGDMDEAIRNLNEALRLKPDLAQVRNVLNNINRMGQLDQQIAQYTEMLEGQPDDPALHGKIALAYFQKGAHNQALEHWRQAIRLKPDWPEPYHNLAGFLAITKDQELRNPGEAVRLGRRAAELSQFKNAAILDTLSIAYAATDN
ncbi:sulfatase-like hydrolase/transferase, partial [Planctomycetota bacterium]